MNREGDANDRADEIRATGAECFYQIDSSKKLEYEGNVRTAIGCKAKQNVSCDSCSEEFNLDDARFCENCTEKLCKSCYEIYRHKTKETLQPITLHGKCKQNECMETCKNHPGKLVDCFCGICDKTGCSVCMVSAHRNCPSDSIKYIPNISVQFQESKEYQHFSKLLDQFGTDLETEVNKYDSNRRRANFLLERATEEIKNQRENVNQFFDALQNKLETKLRIVHEDNENILESVSNTHSSIKHYLTSLKSKLETDNRNGNMCQLFSDTKTGKEKLERLQAEMLNVRKENEIPYYEIEHSTDLQSLLTNIEELGKLKPLQKEVQTAADLTASSRKDILPFCCITGMCSVSENKLLIADYKNYKLKVIDTSRNKLHSELTLPGPWAVAKVKDNCFAVTLPTMKAVQFISISRACSICSSYQLLLHGPCRSIACTEKKMIISYFDASVHILSIGGNLLTDLTVDGDGNKRFKKPWNVAISQDETTIYVSDLGKHTVTSITFDGCIKAIFRDDDNGGPRGITVDRKGTIYVCCYLSNKIIQLSKDLIEVRVLLDNKDGIHKHRCLTYCNENNKLFVGKWEEDLIKVVHVK